MKRNCMIHLLFCGLLILHFHQRIQITSFYFLHTTHSILTGWDFAITSRIKNASFIHIISYNFSFFKTAGIAYLFVSWFLGLVRRCQLDGG